MYLKWRARLLAFGRRLDQWNEDLIDYLLDGVVGDRPRRHDHLVHDEAERYSDDAGRHAFRVDLPSADRASNHLTERVLAQSRIRKVNLSRCHVVLHFEHQLHQAGRGAISKFSHNHAEFVPEIAKIGDDDWITLDMPNDGGGG